MFPLLQRNTLRHRQRLGTKYLRQRCFRQQLLFQHQLVDAASGGVGFDRDRGRVGIADIGVERSDEADRVLDIGPQNVSRLAVMPAMQRCSSVKNAARRWPRF